MKKLLGTLLMALPLLIGGSVLAHENHDHGEELTSATAASLGDKALPDVIKSKKLDASWQKAQRQETKAMNAGGGKIWTVSYLNAQEKVATNRTLYLFFDELGNFVAANHSGTPPEA